MFSIWGTDEEGGFQWATLDMVYSLVDLTECSLLNLPNYLYYAPMFTKYLNTQKHFLDKHLYGTLYIINNNTVKTILNNITSKVLTIEKNKV